MTYPLAATPAVPVTPAPAALPPPSRALPQPSRASTMLRVLMILLIAVVYGRLHDLSGPTSVIPIGKVLLPLGWIALLLQPKVKLRLTALRTKQAKMFYLLIFGMIMSVPFSLYRSSSLEDLIGFCQSSLPFVLLIGAVCTTASDLYSAARTVVLTGALLGGALVAGLGREVQGRVTLGATYDPNDIALVGVVVFPFAVWMMRSKKTATKWLGVAGGGGGLLLVMESASRGGMIGLAAVVLLIVIRYNKHIPMQWKLGGAAMLTIALIKAPPTFWERFNTLKDPNADYNAFDPLGRKAIWKRGLTYFMRRPLTGVGLSQFGSAEGEWAVATLGTTAGFKWSTAHSVWVQVLAEIGLFGIIGFVGLYVPTLRDIRKVRKVATRAPPDQELLAFGDALGIAIIGFFVSGTFLAMAYSPPAMLIAALGIGYTRVARTTFGFSDKKKKRQRRSAAVPALQRPSS